ncbi:MULTISPECIES: antibiotic biosynthesis monooxygenase [unclassified Pseudomonas]|uniref:antibiotic biosynthesis monooxygenase n=1 Tax=unclassified Pseudomonas TaxID=196821 RepID=UPI00114D267F|nr:MULTISPECIES: antibiotic biosynthesis monooxygenase [unclassified Pseudomonas]QIH08037.1 hypothetical protein ATY02_15655 [Pseudomonas sp. BIOMIG1BAC]UMZ15093.1 hypothetical protein I9018_15930 [Pseudomonas sp. MPFS]
MSSVVDLAKKREVIELVVRLRALPGCTSFSFTRSKDDCGVWVLNSHWISNESMRSYFFEKDLADLIQMFSSHCKEMRFNTFFIEQEVGSDA